MRKGQLVTTVLFGLWSLSTLAQGGGPAGPGGPPFDQGGDRLSEVRTQIRASNEQWKVIGPKLRKVIVLRQVVESDQPARVGMNGPDGRDEPPGGRGVGGLGDGGHASNDPFLGPVGGLSGGRRGGQGDQRDQGGPGGGGRRRPGGAGGNPGGSNVVAEALHALQVAIGNEQSTPDEIRERLTAFRLVRKKAQRELETAQRDLLLLLTPDQEAMLVSLRYLD